jgi:hypothetical protein
MLFDFLEKKDHLCSYVPILHSLIFSIKGSLELGSSDLSLLADAFNKAIQQYPRTQPRVLL